MLIVPRTVLFAFTVLLVMPASGAVPDHADWDQLLQHHVQMHDQNRTSSVDYAGMAQERPALRQYLQSLQTVSREDFDAWPMPDQLAFLINAYNAWTVELILQYYPDIDSIRDIGFLPGAAWRRNIASLFGEQVSLDDIEHGMIRGWPRFQEPRIHFAVNCAAIGCPALRNEAYTGARLEQQLEENTERFLSDRERNFMDKDVLRISPIFDWYREDFEKGWQGIDSVEEFLLAYANALGLDDRQRERLRDGQIRLRYSDYDWSLNSLRAAR